MKKLVRSALLCATLLTITAPSWANEPQWVSSMLLGPVTLPGSTALTVTTNLLGAKNIQPGVFLLSPSQDVTLTVWISGTNTATTGAIGLYLGTGRTFTNFSTANQIYVTATATGTNDAYVTTNISKSTFGGSIYCALLTVTNANNAASNSITLRVGQSHWINGPLN